MKLDLKTYRYSKDVTNFHIVPGIVMVTRKLLWKLWDKKKIRIKYYRKECKSNQPTKKKQVTKPKLNWVGPTDWAVFDSLILIW